MDSSILVISETQIMLEQPDMHNNNILNLPSQLQPQFIRRRTRHLDAQWNFCLEFLSLNILRLSSCQQH
jgi:hypothetical protein